MFHSPSLHFFTVDGGPYCNSAGEGISLPLPLPLQIDVFETSPSLLPRNILSLLSLSFLSLPFYNVIRTLMYLRLLPLLSLAINTKFHFPLFYAPYLNFFATVCCCGCGREVNAASHNCLNCKGSVKTSFECFFKHNADDTENNGYCNQPSCIEAYYVRFPSPKAGYLIDFIASSSSLTVVFALTFSKVWRCPCP